MPWRDISCRLTEVKLLALQVPKVAGVDSLTARLGHLLRVASKMGRHQVTPLQNFI